MTEFSGVRSSWLMFAQNLFFESDAARAPVQIMGRHVGI